MERTVKKLLTVRETAEILGVGEGSVKDRRFRARIGLKAVRLGARVAFREEDIEAAVQRNVERTPACTVMGKGAKGGEKL